jgi:hypothetical protein
MLLKFGYPLSPNRRRASWGLAPVTTRSPSCRLHVNDRAVNDVLEAGRSLGCRPARELALIHGRLRHRDCAAQPLKIDFASAHYHRCIGIVSQRKQKVLHRCILVTSLFGDCERPAERFVKARGEDRHGGG